MESKVDFYQKRAGARLSPCRLYRYLLWRRWGDPKFLNWILLNPSIADEVTNDPTIVRCERRARWLGYGGIIVTNLFAFRATIPADMKAVSDPIGPDNDGAILEAAEEAELIVCGWGKNGTHLGRAAKVRSLLADKELHYLRMGKDGQPWHPLYVAYQQRPIKWLER